MSYDLGKKLVFAGMAGKVALTLFINVLGKMLAISGIGTLWTIIHLVAMAGIAAGFFIMWQSEGDIFDAGIAGCVILSVIMSFINPHMLEYKVMIEILLGLASTLHFFVWALKSFLGGNMIKTLAVGGLGVWVAIITPILNYFAMRGGTDAVIAWAGWIGIIELVLCGAVSVMALSEEPR